jgi:hypothetical protein
LLTKEEHIKIETIIINKADYLRKTRKREEEIIKEIAPGAHWATISEDFIYDLIRFLCELDYSQKKLKNILGSIINNEVPLN